jgi:hypothetical protein
MGPCTGRGRVTIRSSIVRSMGQDRLTIRSSTGRSLIRAPARFALATAIPRSRHAVSALTANVCLITKVIAALHWACLPSAQRTRTSPANVLRGLFLRMSGCGPNATSADVSSYVSFWGRSGPHLLALSISGHDPKPSCNWHGRLDTVSRAAIHRARWIGTAVH